MSLKLWLPLISDNKNQGISGYTSTGSPTSWGNGPIGGCATFNDVATDRIIVNDNQELRFIDVDFSYCFWLTKNFAAKTANGMHAFTQGRTDYGDTRGYGVGIASTTQLRFYYGTSSWVVSGVPDNEWHHVAFTYKGGSKIVKMYIDGVLKSTQTFSGTLPTYTESNGVCVGNFQGSIYPLIGSICDFRIYNNTLSDKEIHEISNGLLIHYKLNEVNSLPGNPNLLTWSREYSQSNPIVHTTSSKDGIKYLGNDSLVTLTPGKVYYITVHSDAVPGTHGSIDTLAKRNQFTIFLYLRNQGTSKAIGQYDSAPNLNVNNIYINDPENNLYVWKWTAPSNAQDITFRTNLYSDGTTSITHYFWDLKIELDSYTTFVPGQNQPQYAMLGYGLNTVEDVSGYSRHSSLNGTPTTNNSTPRYERSLNISAGNCIYPIPDPIKSTTKEFTISLWFNSSSISTQQCIWNGRTTTGKAVGIFLIGSKLRVDDDNQTTCSTTLESNKWYHLAVTWKYGGNKITYLNGVQDSSVAASSTLSKSNTKASLGRSSTDSLSTSNYFQGMMSDFRIYGKALSQSDVKALYNNPISISNKGELFTTSIEEGNSFISHTRTGISKASNISELPGKYDTNLYFEPDGSCWVRIVHHNAPATYLFTGTDPFRSGVYKDTNRFFDGSICDMVDKWEFMVIQQEETTSPIYKARWIQPKNPNVAVFADVPASAITRILTEGYVSHGFGGLYHNNGNTYWCCNNGTSGNWWGAVGAYANNQGGIPAMKMNGSGGIVKTGFEDVYIRIDNVIWTNSKRTVCSFDKGSNGILSTEFIEY